MPKNDLPLCLPISRFFWLTSASHSGGFEYSFISPPLAHGSFCITSVLAHIQVWNHEKETGRSSKFYPMQFEFYCCWTNISRTASGKGAYLPFQVRHLLFKKACFEKFLFFLNTTGALAPRSFPGL